MTGVFVRRYRHSLREDDVKTDISQGMPRKLGRGKEGFCQESQRECSHADTLNSDF